MQDIAAFTQQIFDAGAGTFDSKALTVFRYQAEENPVYRDFLHYLDISVNDITALHHIPFLPISAFKHHRVIT
jgi:hypothetical protein